MTYDLWPPSDYPDLTAPTPTVTGCTRNSTVSGLSTFTAQTPAVDAVTTRLIRPIFVKGQGGVLRWSVTVTPAVTNLLTANQASGTDTLGDTTGFSAPGGATIGSSSAQAFQGSKSFAVTATGTGNAYGALATATRIPVVGGDTYTLFARMRSDQPSGETAAIYVAWYAGPSGGSTISPNLTATTASVNSAGWTTFEKTGSAPVTANYAEIYIIRLGGAAGAVTFVDTIGLWAGSSGQWAMPGEPVLGGTGGKPELDVRAQVIFLDDDDAQVDRWTGPEWHIASGIVLSARAAVPRRATQAQLKVLSLSDTASGHWTEYDSRLEQIPADDPYVPPAVDVSFGDVSPEGVAPPAPPAGLPGFEANSPARRSPQVRWCQLHDSIRPDLTPKKNAREV